MQKILIIDNYDSFTYNLYQLVGSILTINEQSFELKVVYNNQITLKEANQFDKIIISPGPGNPSDSKYFGVCGEIILNSTKPILGVCLGMQGIAHFYGGNVIKANKQMHGKTSLINHNQTDIFANLPSQIEVMRYHSLIVETSSLPDCLEITASTEIGEIMALKHKSKPIFGVQFHPESFASAEGNSLLANFLQKSF